MLSYVKNCCTRTASASWNPYTSPSRNGRPARVSV